MTTRGGSNGGGKGGRNHRLNWTDADGASSFANYKIERIDFGGEERWVVEWRGVPLRRALRFKSLANAKRWVEKRIAEHPSRARA